ncbi:MAG: Xaa-Pro peptidase family protein [bacterium]|nr:Xaa-Pro peptidase family protein [bacterium]
MDDPCLRRRAATVGRLDGLGGLLVMTAENRRYLTGFTGSWGAVLLTPAETVLLTDSRYVEQAATEAPGCRVLRHGAEWSQTLGETVTGMGLHRLGFEKENVTVGLYEKLSAALPGTELVPTEGRVEAGRAIKDDGELQSIRSAAALTDQVLTEALELIRPGMIESELALALELGLRRNGAEVAFEIIVASGPRSSLPHGRPSDRVLAAGDLVTIDMGARVNGYHSDLTRTFALGKPDSRQEEIYQVVREAQTAALAGMKPGMTGREADALARDIINARGFGEYFGHGLGHGVGLAVHEGPRVSLTGETALREGNVVTVEPGIYIPGWGGVRIEDLVVLRPTGVEMLSSFTRELVVL